MEHDPSYVTAIADRLETLGLVERQPHPTDRRVKNLTLTSKGRRLKANIPAALWGETNAFSTLDTVEHDQLAALLARIVNQ